MESAQICICASESEVRTGLLLIPEGVYDFSASGHWFDASIPAGPEGYPSERGPFWMRWFERWRRQPDANWFELIGAFGNGEMFNIGLGRQGYRPPKQGTQELICFANDLSGFYWNNSGGVVLTVTRAK
jgi:hypothetical protein